VDDCPGGDAVGELVGRRGGTAVEDLGGSLPSSAEADVVAVQQLGPEHHREVGSVGNGEADVGDADLEELAAGTRRLESVTEEVEAVDGDGGEQPGLVPEVVGGGGVGDPGTAGDLAQTERRRAGVADDLDGSAQQRGTEVAVMVGPV
jgi:hypothetical protein